MLIFLTLQNYLLSYFEYLPGKLKIGRICLHCNETYFKHDPHFKAIFFNMLLFPFVDVNGG